MNTVMFGETQATFVPATIWLPLVNAGKWQAIAFTGSKRLPGLPDLQR